MLDHYDEEFLEGLFHGINPLRPIAAPQRGTDLPYISDKLQPREDYRGDES